MTLLATIKMIVTPKEASEEVGLIDIVEAPGNGRAITIPTNELCIVSAHKNTESVNAKLTPHESSSIRGQLAKNKLGILRDFLEKEKVSRLMISGVWVTEWVR